MNEKQGTVKRFLVGALWIMMLAFAGSVVAHDGPLDEKGCHRDNRDYYHCH